MNRLLIGATFTWSALVGLQSAHAGGQEKAHDVGKDGLVLQGEIVSTDAKVKVIVGDRSAMLPAKRFDVRLSAGKRYRITLDSNEIDSVLVVQDKVGKQHAWDDDSGGGLNSLLTLDVPRDDVYKVYAASLKGAGRFTLSIRDGSKAEDIKAAEAKVHEVGGGLKLTGELGQTQAITYQVKLAAGKSYVIDMTSPNPKALDPFLRLQDAEGRQLAEDDDTGGALNARIIYQIERAGVYRVVAMCFGKGQGPFMLTVREARAGERALTKDEQAQLAKATQLNAKVIDLYSTGRASEAIKPAEEALAIRKAVLGEQHPEYAESLNNLALLVKAQGNYAKAEPLYLQARDIRKAALGEQHPDYAESLNNVAVLYQTQGKYANAEPLYVQACDIFSAALGEQHPRYAASLNNLALLVKAQGNYAKAEPLYVQACDIFSAALGEQHPRYAASLNNLAALYQAQGKYWKAEPLHVQARDIVKAVVGGQHPDYATSLHNLACLYQAQGNYAKAELLYVQARDIRKAALGEQHSEYARSLNNLAALYEAQVNYAKAEQLYLQARDIRKAALGEQHPDYAQSLHNLAVLYQAQGNYAKAEPLFVQARDIEKAELGEQHPAYGESLNNLAALYDAQGNYAKAEPLYVQARDICKAALSEQHPEYAASLNNLAALYQAQGTYAKAEPLYVQARDIFKAALGEQHPEYATNLHNLASLYKTQGNYAKAEPLYVQARDIFKAVLGEQHSNYARSLNNLAGLYETQGNYAKAEPLFVQALRTLQVTSEAVPLDSMLAEHLRSHPDSIMTLRGHAVTTLAGPLDAAPAGRLRPSDRSLHLALQVLERVRQHGMHEAQDKVQLADDQFNLFAFRLHVLGRLFALEQDAQCLRAAVETAEQGSARAFLEAVGRSRANRLAGISAALQQRESALLQELRLLELRIAKESSRPLSQRDPESIRSLIAQQRDAEKKLQAFIGQLEKDYPQYAGLRYPRPCALEQARACLAADEVALLFVPGPQASFAVVVEARPKPGDPAEGLAIVRLPAAALLAEHVAGLNELETLALPARARALGRDAYDAILGPCKERIAGKALVIVPGDVLGLLPFELLVDEAGKYLVETHRVRYAPSLTALHLIGLWKQQRAAPAVPLFAVGDPLYESGVQLAATGDSDAMRELVLREGHAKSFKRLMHSGKEVADIAKLLGAKPEYVLTGAAASEANVKAAGDRMAQARYVHFATHGVLGVAKGKQPALVLNLVGHGGEDGFLEYEEILNLKLNADLVVLSACRTGQGKMARGEGVTGLARAFLYAGSKGVVCSLWSVDDRETANLMVDFYGHLQKGRPAAEALREAQLTMIRAGKAPLYWAPFILIGE